MSEPRPLRGGCQCGRNRYSIAIPQGSAQGAQVLFNTQSHHQTPLATLLAAYIRVPLSWYHSTTYAFFPDETHATIRRAYTHPSRAYAKRHFCGFCGTPLSYWSEEPPSEADFINLTIGSLLREDLQDLEDMGLLPDDDDDDDGGGGGGGDDRGVAENKEEGGQASTAGPALRQSFGVPWLEGLVQGTRLGKMRRSNGSDGLRAGRVRLDWDVVDFSDQGDLEMEGGPGKRKLEEREG